MSADRRDRSRACFLGLAVGDALGGPSEGLSAAAIRARWGRIEDFLTPDQAGSDDTEYALFNARLLLRHGPGLTAEHIAHAWRDEIIGSANTFAGAGFSELLAIRNLRQGAMPPHSGQHVHAWSDGLAMRVAPFGIVAAARPELAARLAGMDGSVTHAGEGIYAGQAVAAAIARAFGPGPIDDVINEARQAVPAHSWTRRAIDRATEIGRSHGSVWDAIDPLIRAIVPSAYFWPDIGPEAVGLAFGVMAAARGEFRPAVIGAVNVGRDTDTVAGIVGAVLGAMHGTSVIPAAWTARVDVARGTCLAHVRGMSITATADELASLAMRWS